MPPRPSLLMVLFLLILLSMPTLNCSLQGPAHGPVTGPVPTSNSHSNARQVALKILSTSSSTSTKSSSLISSLQSPSDRNLCTNLVQTANRREGHIDDIIQRHAKKRPKKVSPNATSKLLLLLLHLNNNTNSSQSSSLNHRKQVVLAALKLGIGKGTKLISNKTKRLSTKAFLL